MRYAEVSVNSPIAQRKAFSYSISDDLKVEVGQAVWVPFGEKTLQGIVLELGSQPAVEETRDISGIIDPRPLLSPARVALALWISRYYMAPLFDSVALMLPPGFERKVITYLQRSSITAGSTDAFNSEEQELLAVIPQGGRIRLKDLEKTLGVNRTSRAVTHLVNRHRLEKIYELEKPRIKPKMVPYLVLKASPEEVRQSLINMDKKARKQSALLEWLAENPTPVDLAVLKAKLGFSSQIIKALIEKGLIEIQPVRVDRDPLSAQSINLTFPLSLNSAQESARNLICLALKQETESPQGRPEVFLLQGVTGSGKTEVYIRVLEEAVKLGRRGIVLVPEIAMTPQIIERFQSRFPGQVAVLHSQLSPGEQFDEWQRIRDGEFAVVIGPRSAIFAPQPNLGLIILDEEHEWTYKQQDITPRYHTRDVAIKQAELTGAVVVLGSATPDVESYFKATHGAYHLLELPERVTPVAGTPLPQVEVVDLRQELKSRNLSLFSRSLHNAIETALYNHDQVLLFLNRRGAASFVECRSCGWVIRCKRCEVPLSYHFTDEVLICHQCNHQSKVPLVCPQCRSRQIKYLGVGTEKLEQETARVFPQARILRWDSDAVRGQGHAHQEFFEKFRRGEADILIGTQMITKGLDLPNVTLVGVVSADIALNLPDFRAGERTFQLLSQVAGRAGRGQRGGKVIIQTYSPGHYAIQAAARHDYADFYRKEIAYRLDLHNPPFNRLARLMYTHNNDRRCQEETERIRNLLEIEIKSRGLAEVSLIGPAPAFIHRLRAQYRWQLTIRARDPAVLLSGISFPRGWSVDIDPVGIA